MQDEKTLCRIRKTPGGYRGFRFSYEGGDSELFNYLDIYTKG